MRLIAGLALLLSILCGATGASAHATLVSTDPGDGSILALAPKSVHLRFNEAVTPAVVRVIDAAGLAIEIARCLELARQRGESGVQEQLSVFFKLPMSRGEKPEQAFHKQDDKLLTWLG